MFRNVRNLKISQDNIAQLVKNGNIFVEDINRNSESHQYLTEKELRYINLVPKIINSSDLFKKVPKREKILTPCKTLNQILDGGFQCGTMTELCGEPGSGKSQICFQACVAVQLNNSYGGLNGKVVYIDTRNGFSPVRVTVIEASAAIDTLILNEIGDKILKI